MQRQSTKNFLYKTDEHGQHAGDPLIEEVDDDPISANEVVSESKKVISSEGVLNSRQLCLNFPSNINSPQSSAQRQEEIGTQNEEVVDEMKA